MVSNQDLFIVELLYSHLPLPKYKFSYTERIIILKCYLIEMILLSVLDADDGVSPCSTPSSAGWEKCSFAEGKHISHSENLLQFLNFLPLKPLTCNIGVDIANYSFAQRHFHKMGNCGSPTLQFFLL